MAAPHHISPVKPEFQSQTPSGCSLEYLQSAPNPKARPHSAVLSSAAKADGLGETELIGVETEESFGSG